MPRKSPNTYDRGAVEERLYDLSYYFGGIDGREPKCYLSGPMTGLPYFNFPAFEKGAEILRLAGWFVYSPRENDAEQKLPGSAEGKFEDLGVPFKDVIKLDLWQVCDSDAVFVLPGWEHSRGSLIEVDVAHRVGVPVYTLLEGREIEAPEDKPHEFSSRASGELVERPDSRSGVIGGSTPPSPTTLDFGPSWREKSEEGTSKGRREAIFSNIPVYALIQEARVHGNSVVPKDGEPAKYVDTEPGVPNWLHGAPYSWFIDALWRHLLAYGAGLSFDHESGLHNLAHVRWMCGWLMEHERRGTGTDDRLKGQVSGG